MAQPHAYGIINCIGNGWRSRDKRRFTYAFGPGGICRKIRQVDLGMGDLRNVSHGWHFVLFQIGIQDCAASCIYNAFFGQGIANALGDSANYLAVYHCWVDDATAIMRCD